MNNWSAIIQDIPVVAPDMETLGGGNRATVRRSKSPPAAPTKKKKQLTQVEPNPRPVPMQYKHLHTIKSLGTGGAADVYEVEAMDHTHYALKVFRDQTNFSERWADTRESKYHEVDVNMFLFWQVGAAVVPCYGGWYNDKQRLCVLLGLAQESMKQWMEDVDAITEGNQVTEQECIVMISGLFEALVMIHESGIVHGDIKPDNILWFEESDNRARWVFADFGVCYDSRFPQLFDGYEGSGAYLNWKSLIQGKIPSCATDVYALSKSANQMFAEHHIDLPTHSAAKAAIRRGMDLTEEDISNGPEVTRKVAALWKAALVNN